jgi:hypothetical protein
LWIKRIRISGAHVGPGKGGEPMPLPFLHRFLASVRRTEFELQLEREVTHAWPLSLLGPDGPQMLAFEVLGLGEQAPRKPGVFIYARRRAEEWQALYVGESANMADRLAFNEIAADALLSGATDIHVLKLGADAKARRDLADRLIVTNRPPLNEEERIRLAPAIVESERKPSKGKIRAA